MIGPMAWTVTSEIFPSRNRSQSMALCVAANWIFSFLLAFFTPFITGSIGFAYGYVFAGCNLAAVVIVFFFLPETSGKSLEQIDSMFLSRVVPWKSSHWTDGDGAGDMRRGSLHLTRTDSGTASAGEGIKSKYAA